MKPALSIIVPTYNRARLLERLLASIEPQLRPEVEVIVMSNASTDDTAQTVRRFSFAEHRRSHTNFGFDRNLIRGVRAASGSHCWFIGDDDWLYPGAIARVLDAIQNAPRSIILGDAINHRWDGVVEPYISCTEWEDYATFNLAQPLTTATFLSRALTHRVMLTFISNVVFPRDRWPADASRWVDTGYVHTFCWWNALRHGTPLTIRKRPLVNATIGHPNKRDAETVAYVQNDVLNAQSFAKLLSHDVDRRAMRRAWRLAYGEERVINLSDWLRHEPTWPPIAEKLHALLRGDHGEQH